MMTNPFRTLGVLILWVVMTATSQVTPLHAAPLQQAATPGAGTDNGNISLVVSAVKLQQPNLGAEMELASNTVTELQAGTRITVSETGEALLGFPPALAVRLFRDVVMQREVAIDPSAPFLLSVQLFAGAIFGKESPQIAAEKRISIEVNTGWALIRPTGTQFWVYFNPATQTSWVIVKEGKVDVTAAGTTVTVLARQQTWVQPAEPPVNPIPARRALIGNLFPSVDSLTNGAMTDADLLEPAPATATPTPTPTPTATPTRRRAVVITRRPVRATPLPTPTPVVEPQAPAQAPPPPPTLPPTVVDPASRISIGVKPNPVPYGGTAQVWWVIPADVFQSGSFDKADGAGFIGPVGNSFVVTIPNMTESRTVWLRWQDVNGGTHQNSVFIPVSAAPPETVTPVPPEITPTAYVIPIDYGSSDPIGPPSDIYTATTR